MLHDLGKVLIPSKILNKPARLNKKEREIMNIHSTLGYELLKTQKINRETLDLVKYHHQNLIHSGYPALNCDHNPSDIGVQIISTADKYSALREARVYRRKLTRIESLRFSCGMLRENSPSEFVTFEYDEFLRETEAYGRVYPVYASSIFPLIRLISCADAIYPINSIAANKKHFNEFCPIAIDLDMSNIPIILLILHF
jgi:hypothetical protein